MSVWGSRQSHAIDSLRIARDQPAPSAARAGFIAVGLVALFAGAAWWGLGALAEVQSPPVARVENAGPTRGAMSPSAASWAAAPAGTSGSAVALAAQPQDPYFEASGFVVARRKATVAAEVSGRLAEVRIDEGDRVQSGQVLARLDSSDAADRLRLTQAELRTEELARAETEAELMVARAAHERSLQLHAQGMISEDASANSRLPVQRWSARLAHIEGKVEVARRNVVLAEGHLRRFVIVAPFSGVVVQKSAQVGEYISPQSAGGAFTRTCLATIVDMASIEAEVDVSELFLRRVAVGQKATVRLNAYPDWIIPGEVIAIVPTAEPQSATVKVRVRLTQADARILPSMGLKASFAAAEPGAAAAPAAAAHAVSELVR